LLNGPEEWSAADEKETFVMTFIVSIVDVVFCVLCPELAPETETVNVTDEEGGVFPDASIEKVNTPMPEAPGAKSASDGSVSRLNTIV
jgi:hypothetical protein